MFFNSANAATKKVRKAIEKERAAKTTEKQKRRSMSIDETTISSDSPSIRERKKIEKDRATKTIEKQNHCLVSVKEKAPRSDSSSIQESLSGSSINIKKGTVSYAEHKANKALHSIEATISSQESREQDLEIRIKDTLIQAKHKLAGGNKRSALRSMRKVKLEQSELNKVSSVIETLEAQKLHIESSLNSINVLKVMQEGSETLQGLNSNAKVADIDDVIDGIRDTMDMTAEINDILTAPVDNILIEDDELLRELEQIGNESNQSAGLGLPSVPTGELPQPNANAEKSPKSIWML